MHMHQVQSSRWYLVIAGLETGAVNATETIYDTGIYPKGYNPRCWIYSSYGRGHGALNVSGAIKILVTIISMN